MVWPGSGAGGAKGISNLLQAVSIKENPSKLNDFGGILGNVDAVFIAGSRNMDHDVAVDVELRLLRRHDGDGSAGSSQQTYMQDAERRLSTVKRSPDHSQWVVERGDRSTETADGSLGPQPARIFHGRAKKRAMGEAVTRLQEALSEKHKKLPGKSEKLGWRPGEEKNR